VKAPDVMTLGTVFAKSGYFQDARDAAQAVVKMLAGQELGFGPVASMTGIYIVKGRVSLSANLIAAAVKKGGKYNYRVAELSETACKIVFFEGKEQIGESSFTMEDAKIAGLVTENYRKFARNMLFARAMSNGAKWFCADVFGGPAYMPDELGASIDMETGEMLERPTDERLVVPTLELATPETTKQHDDPEPSDLEREEKIAVLDSIAKGYGMLKMSLQMQLVLWKKHTASEVFLDPDSCTLDALNALLGELRALHRAAESRKR
jgi:hypothetical protein